MSTGPSSVRPSGVRLYSTRGGTSGWAVRTTSPSRSRLRSVRVSMRWEMPPSMPRWRSLKRCVPSPSTEITSTLHLSPMRSST